VKCVPQFLAFSVTSAGLCFSAHAAAPALIEEVVVVGTPPERYASSTTDALTGLYNRRGFERFLETALATAKRHDETGVVGFFDLDGFKTINDTLGHSAGDAVIAGVAEILHESTRSFDCVARLGGDEFAVVLVRCKPLAGARRLRALQEQLDTAGLSYAGQSLPVSASLGLRPFEADSDLRALLLETDRAMYQDKRHRNRASA